MDCTRRHTSAKMELYIFIYMLLGSFVVETNKILRGSSRNIDTKIMDIHNCKGIRPILLNVLLGLVNYPIRKLSKT